MKARVRPLYTITTGGHTTQKVYGCTIDKIHIKECKNYLRIFAKTKNNCYLAPDL